MKRYIKKFVVWLCILIIVVTIPQNYFAQEIKKVRVGIFEMEGFHQYDEEGELEGYCIDYLNILSRLGNWQFEYVEVVDFMDGCNKLEQQEIDLIAPAVSTDIRRDTYAYSELSLGVEYTVLLTKADRTDLYYEDFTYFDGMKVAVLNGYPMTDYFLSYMKMHQFEAELVYFNSVEESWEALQNGQVDAMVDSIMNVREDQRILAKFTPRPIYFLMNKENIPLQKALNDAMSRAEETYPMLKNELLDEYYPIYDEQFFTREEAEYIAEKNVLNVAYVANRKPLSFTDENGELAGISKAIFDRIAEISGLEFQYVALPEGVITYELLTQQDIDLLTGVEYNNANVNSDNILLSRPYISARKVMVSCKDFSYHPTENYKVAVATGSQTIHKVLHSEYPNLTIIDYENIDECFEALRKGKVDMLLQNQYVVEAILSKPIYDEYVVVPMEGLADELCFSTIMPLKKSEVQDKESTLLISILNKSISQITDTEMNNILVRETLEHPYEVDFMDFVYVCRYAILVFLGALMVGAVALCIYNGKMKKYKLLEEEENRRNILLQKRYKTIIECSEDLIYEISLNGEASMGSEKIKKKFGWEIPNNVENLDFDKIAEILHIHPEDKSVFTKTMVLDNTEKFHEQLMRIGTTDDIYIWCKVSRMVLLDDAKEIVSILGKIVDVDEEIKEKQRLEISSRTDPLTGLLNKIAFEKEVRQYIEKNMTENACFVFLDMDHLKISMIFLDIV